MSSIEGAQSVSHLAGKRSADRAWGLMTDGSDADDVGDKKMTMRMMHQIHPYPSYPAWRPAFPKLESIAMISAVNGKSRTQIFSHADTVHKQQIC